MKTTLLFALLSSLIYEGAAQSFSIGTAGIYGDDIGNAGIQLRGYYNMKGNRVCFGPEFSSFFTTSESHNGEVTKRKLSEMNFNLHYIIEITEKWGVYPLAGLNYSIEKEEVEVSSEIEKHNLEKLGTNLGIGVHRAKNKWVFFGEYDHLFSELSQNSFIVGAFFTLGKTHNEHKNE